MLLSIRSYGTKLQGLHGLHIDKETSTIVYRRNANMAKLSFYKKDIKRVIIWQLLIDFVYSAGIVINPRIWNI